MSKTAHIWRDDDPSIALCGSRDHSAADGVWGERVDLCDECNATSMRAMRSGMPPSPDPLDHGWASPTRVGIMQSQITALRAEKDSAVKEGEFWKREFGRLEQSAGPVMERTNRRNAELDTECATWMEMVGRRNLELVAVRKENADLRAQLEAALVEHPAQYVRFTDKPINMTAQEWEFYANGGTAQEWGNSAPQEPDA